MASLDIDIVERGDKAFVAYGGDEFELMRPRSVDTGLWQAVGDGFARSIERQMAMYGISTGTGKKLAGEFILQSRFKLITSIGMPESYKCVQVTLRNDAISTPYPIMLVVSQGVV
jgi:hypothetical protein